MKSLKTVGICMALALSLPFQRRLNAQDSSSSKAPESAVATDPSTIPNAIHLLGLPDTKPAISGMLEMTGESVEFTTSDVHASIPYNRIVAVFAGTQRTEVGGKAGALGRKMPYGAGEVFSLASKKQVDLITIEFRDTHGGYHGTVFVVPLNSAAPFQSGLTARIAPLTDEVDTSGCTNGAPIPNSVMLAPVKVDGVDLPAEYRILLYEHVHHMLSTTDLTNTYLRPGDRSATGSCAALTPHVTVVGFKKGNQSLRAATGPLGMFVGLTSVTFNIKLEDSHGKILLQHDIKKSKRGDSDSLNVAHDIAKDIAKRVDKVMKKTNGTGQPVQERISRSRRNGFEYPGTKVAILAAKDGNLRPGPFDRIVQGFAGAAQIKESEFLNRLTLIPIHSSSIIMANTTAFVAAFDAR